MKEVPLSNGAIALVDDCDYELVMTKKWYLLKGHNTLYAHTFNSTDHKESVYLHRFILNPSLGIQVDHIDGNGLNCTRINMRLCSNTQNHQNERKRKCNNPHKGVTRDKYSRGWGVSITINGRIIFLGTFYNPYAAALAYDKAARQYFGEFAQPNFPDIIATDEMIADAEYTKPGNWGRHPKRLCTSSHFLGVSWQQDICRWTAKIAQKHKRCFLGTFKTEEAAAHAYDIKAYELFGESAQLNFPIGDHEREDSVNEFQNSHEIGAKSY